MHQRFILHDRVAAETAAVRDSGVGRRFELLWSAQLGRGGKLQSGRVAGHHRFADAVLPILDAAVQAIRRP